MITAALKEKAMDVAYISTLAALGGSVIGGVTSTSMSWLTQGAQTRSGQLAHEFTGHEELYRDFIIAASKTYGDALVSSEPKLPELIALRPRHGCSQPG